MPVRLAWNGRVLVIHFRSGESHTRPPASANFGEQSSALRVWGERVALLYTHRATGVLMTLVVGVQTDEGILLAADGRVTRRLDTGALTVESDTAQKLFRGKGGQWGFGIAGTESMALGMVDRLCDLESSGCIRTTARTVSAFLERECAGHFSGFTCTQWPAASILIAGCDSNGVGKMYCLESEAGFMLAPPRQRQLARIGSGHQCPIVTQLLQHEYALTASQAKMLAVFLIRCVAAIDPTVGGTCRMALIDSSGYQEIDTSEIAQIEGWLPAIDDRLRQTLWAALSGEPRSQP